MPSGPRTDCWVAQDVQATPVRLFPNYLPLDPHRKKISSAVSSLLKTNLAAYERCQRLSRATSAARCSTAHLTASEGRGTAHSLRPPGGRYHAWRGQEWLHPTFVERKSGYLLAAVLPKKYFGAVGFADIAQVCFAQIPERYRKTLTLDNGPEMKLPERIERTTGTTPPTILGSAAATRTPMDSFAISFRRRVASLLSLRKILTQQSAY